MTVEFAEVFPSALKVNESRPVRVPALTPLDVERSRTHVAIRKAPTIKVATNSDMYARMTEDMDVDAGTMLTEGVSLEEKGREIYELFLRVAEAKGFWGYFLPVVLTMAASMFYELIEWAAAEVFGGDLGIAFVGAQGDVWDAQKDMSLATVGALIAMGVTAFININLQKDFAREWSESLRVKRQKPLGEDEIVRLLNDRNEG